METMVGIFERMLDGQYPDAGVIESLDVRDWDDSIVDKVYHLVRRVLVVRDDIPPALWTALSWLERRLWLARTVRFAERHVSITPHDL